MGHLTILTYPQHAKELHLVATHVDAITDRVRMIAAGLVSTMQAAGGIGLAATQVGILQRILAIQMPSEDPAILINPKIYMASKGAAYTVEACLSVPGVSASVKRHSEVWATWLDLEGEEHDEEFQGLHAACLQHEIDHLDGRLFIDRISYRRRASLTWGV